MNLKKYVDNNKVIFARIVDLPEYQSTNSDIETVLEENMGKKINGINEIENFLVREDNNVYGFVETGYNEGQPNNINHPNFQKEDFLENFLVIFISLKTSKIIGYYKDAKIFRKRQFLHSNFLSIETLNNVDGFTHGEYDQIPYYFVAKSEDVYLFDKEFRIEIKNLKQGGLNYGQSNIKYLDSNNYDYAVELIKNIEDTRQNEIDLLNFHQMLQFWIEQTNNNIEDKGRVKFQEINIENSSYCEGIYKNPKFNTEFLNYNNFNIRISFFRTGHYRGGRVNFIVADIGKDLGQWINIRYLFEDQKLIASYRGDVKHNNENSLYKKYMKENKFDKGHKVSIDLLDLKNSKPNKKTKELFEYFSHMILKTKEYLDRESDNMKVNEVKTKLLNNYNVILRGAPGTGKTYLAREVAANIIGISTKNLDSSDQFAFVQFHPSYDYTDFVEGLRPNLVNGNPSFEVKKGTFYEFCDRAKLSQKMNNIEINKIDDVLEKYELFLKENKHPDKRYVDSLKQLLGIKKYKGKAREILPTYKTIEELLRDIENIRNIDRDNDLRNEFLTPINKFEEFYQKYNNYNHSEKKYVFIIDEINRGEISRIFGELFFSIDPEYRGKKGSVITQYSNLHQNQEKFYVPENVYIIGTMNDIDRSVDTFDFAMRRRFMFEELSAEYSQIMLNNESVINRMTELNNAIVDPELGQLSTDYQIGGSYFQQLDRDEVTVEDLWLTKLEPLLKDYYRGNLNAVEIILQLKRSYNLELERFENEIEFER